MDTADLSLNKRMALHARMSITDVRAQLLVAHWLLRNRVNQDTIDRNRRMVETCARISHTDISRVGDWDALAHCLALSILREAPEWMLDQPYFFDYTRFTTTGEVFHSVFGDRFIGNEYVENFDIHGDAMVTMHSLV
jgi:hypothetical protein